LNISAVNIPDLLHGKVIHRVLFVYKENKRLLTDRLIYKLNALVLCVLLLLI
jgi:hypothetical protein